MKSLLRRFWVVVAAVVFVASPHSSSADESAPDCTTTDVVYDLAASLKITDTPMGAGDGTFVVGPGKVVLRFERQAERTSVKLLRYDLQQHFTVVAKALFFTTRVTSDVQMRSAPPSGVLAEGALVADRTVEWRGRASGLRSDGTLVCDGSMCGKYGAPPAGPSEVHIGPKDVELKPFHFDSEMRTFKMPFALVSETELPKQRTLVSIAGREVKRACVSAPVTVSQ
jgi:hypothetical protein